MTRPRVTWRDVGRKIGGSPERLALAVLLAAFVTAVIGGALAVGATVSPLVGWFVVAVAAGVPTSWLVRRMWTERMRDLAAERQRLYAAEGAAGPTTQSDQPGWSPPNGEEKPAAPSRTWGGGSR